MKAAQINEYGDEDVLRINNDAEKPEPAAGEVLVEVHAAGINPFDWKVRQGDAREMAELDFPATLGGDLAGTVAELGEGVTNLSVGQAVYGQANALGGRGSYAEYTPVKANQLAAKPGTVDFVTAAALPLAAVSAYQALVDTMHLQGGQKILIHGGAGGIGSFAIQLAKNLGAYVATTATGDGLDYVKGIGADEVIDYTLQKFEDILNDYAAVFDTIGGDTNKRSYAVLRQGGILVSMIDQPDEELVKQHGIDYTAQFTHTTTERLNAVSRLVEQGVLKPNVDKVFSLDQAAEALEYQKTGQPKGKVVIQVTD